jgi:hypothetical protein
MKPTEELSATLEYARAALDHNQRGELVLSERKRVWSALGHRVMNGAKGALGIGHKRRAKLAIICARRVLPIWDRVFSEDREPERVLSVAQQYLDQQIEFRAAWNIQNSFWVKVENLMIPNLAEPNIIEIGFATAKALSASLYDEVFDPNNIEPNITDHDLDPHDWDSAFFASCASAGGAVWQTESNDARRREFWDWYLRDAVPLAL